MQGNHQNLSNRVTREEEFVWPAGAFAGVLSARAMAFLADLIVLAVVTFAFFIVFTILGILTLGLLWPGAALGWLVALGYFTFFVGGPFSATPGMRWQGIELRTWDGYRPGYLQAALQATLFYFSVAIANVLILLVPLFNRRRRFLHDYLCGTVVVRTGSQPVS